jgi:osmotically-inducible protein OsmY
VSPLTLPLAVTDRAERLLHGNSYLALKNVKCDFHAGVLTLRGALPTYYLKQVAQTTVAGLDGVDRVVNLIEVVGQRARQDAQ